ncbi:MAG: cytochrome c3 family protein, partial [bacterium]
MKKVVSTIVWFCVLSIFPLSFVKAGNYHVKGKNLNCYDCHTLHFSQDGKIPQVPAGARAWGDAPSDFLLKNITSEMCLMCHDGYDRKAPDVIHPTSRNYQSSAGHLDELDKTVDPNHPLVHGHTMGSTLSPPGYPGRWDKKLSCTSCHDPHGNSYYRNLRPKPLTDSADSPVTYFAGTSVAGNEGKGIQILVDLMDPNDFARYDVSNIIYRLEEGTGGEKSVGLSSWCAACHPDFNPAFHHSGEGDKHWNLHPTNTIAMRDNPSIHEQWSSQNASGIPTSPPAVTIYPDNRGEDRPFCGSCHKAHGSTHEYGLLWENTADPEREDGQYMRDTCQACHNIGDGNYESSPHADPNFGVYRTDKFQRGECEHCHQQHGTPRDPQLGDPSGLRSYYTYNLFGENNKFFCLSAECHGKTPKFYTKTEELSDKGILIRIEEKDKPYGGYFEANDAATGKRKGGLDYRVRWPGQAAYVHIDDPNFSPHGKMKSDLCGPDCDEGSCMHCHKPHGTGSKYDMLKASYKGTVNSANDPNNYELCFNCHGDDPAWAPNGMREETQKIETYYRQPDNYAGHQIKSSDGFARPGDKLACSNCHNPHGSLGHGGNENENRNPNRHLLSDERPGWDNLGDTLTDPNSSRRFCFGCHVPSDCTPKDSDEVCDDRYVEGIFMKPIPDFAEHKKGAKESCHDCHGGSYIDEKSQNVHHLSPGSCNICHADQGVWQADIQKYTGPHKIHTTTYAFACEMCHSWLSTDTGHKATHVNHATHHVPDSDNQWVEICFHDDSIDWKEWSIHGGSYQYRSLYRNPYEEGAPFITPQPKYDARSYDPSYDNAANPGKCDDTRGNGTCVMWTDQSTFIVNSCSAVWCHSNANPLSISDDPNSAYYRENSYVANPSFHLTWDDPDKNPDTGAACNSCHGFLDPDPGYPVPEKWQLSSHHRQHVVVTKGEKAGQAKILCNRCHANTCNVNSNTIRVDVTDERKHLFHVNGRKDVYFAGPDGLPDPQWTYTTGNNGNNNSNGSSNSKNKPFRLASSGGTGSDNNHTCTVSCHRRLSDNEPLPVSWDWNPEDGQSQNQSVCGTCHEVYDPNDQDKTMAKDGHYVHLIAQRGPHSWEPAGAQDRWCSECHSSHDDPAHCDGEISFRDGHDFGSTTVCDSCHSPAGDYDGVKDAKDNWKTGVYEAAADDSLILKAGINGWCVGCHDKAPASSRSDLCQTDPNVKAPNVAGDEKAITPYGTGYGYFVTGHGLSRADHYAASGANGAGASCTDCHDGSLRHIDHTHRTYSASQDNYRDGYRLKAVNWPEKEVTNLTRPLDIPRRPNSTNPPSPNNDPQKYWTDFALCFKCHQDIGALLGDADGPGETNFYDPNKNPNYHLHHLKARFNGTALDWTSSWDNTGDSSISCPACHNVHGSPSPRMMRHGELISTPGSEPPDKVPGINFHYLPDPPEDTKLVNSIGGVVFEQFPRGNVGVSKTGICNTCHPTSGKYFRSPHVDPNDIDFLLRAEALNNPSGGRGIDDGDQLVLTFSTATNGYEGISDRSDVTASFEVYEDEGCTRKRAWGPLRGIEWSDAGGRSHDTLRIILSKDTSLDAIAAGCYLKVIPGKLSGIVGDKNVTITTASPRKIIGTFDCSLVKAYAENHSPGEEPDASEEDRVIISFSGPTLGNGAHLTPASINQALRLNHDHSWGQVQKIEWSSPVADTLIVTFGSGLPASTIAVGDTITLGDPNIRDISGNIITGSVVLEGSFAPVDYWSSPKAVLCSNNQGTFKHENYRSIDGDPNTFWFLGGAVEGEITYDLGAFYWISQVQITTGKGSGSVPVRVWVSGDPECDQNSPLYSPDASLTDTADGPWKVTLIEKEEYDSPRFDAIGRYIRVRGWREGHGPLGELFHEVKFKGVPALTYVNPRIVKAEGSVITPSGSGGTENGRLLTITFNVATNGPEVIKDPNSVRAVFEVYEDGSRKEWGPLTKEGIQWSCAAGHSNDTVTIVLSRDSLIASGDWLKVIPGNFNKGALENLKGKVGDQEILIVSSQKITGSFDCSLVKAEALNHSLRQELGIQGGDRVVLTFAGSTSEKEIDAASLDEALPLSNGHVWGKIQKAEWNAPVHDTLTITFDSDTSFSTIAVGDFITLGKDAVLDQAGNPLTGSVLLEGSFDPNRNDPQIAGAVALNSSFGGKGIDNGDHLVITFNTSTNGPEVIDDPNDVRSAFEVYGDLYYTVRKQWGSLRKIEWSDAGGHSNDTVRITLGTVVQQDAAITAGDYLVVRSGELKGKVGGADVPVLSAREITGTFDCGVVKAYAENHSPDEELDAREGDRVIISFSGPTLGDGAHLTPATISQALRLNNDHSWGQVQKIEWSSPVADTLTVTFGSGLPASTIAVGDTVTLSDPNIRDISGSTITGSVVLEGSFGPVWISPKAVSCSNHQGTRNHENYRSIDGDPNTFWFLQSSPEGEITYDLGAVYRIFQIQITTGGTGTGEDAVRVWVSDDPECDQNSPLYSPDSSLTDTADGPWKVTLIKGEKHNSPQFDAIGRYIRVRGWRVGPGPLGYLFHEVKFNGVTALPHVNPRIVKAEAWNAKSGGAGIDDGDELTITFNVSTNGPDVVKDPNDVSAVFDVYGDDSAEGTPIRKKWGKPARIEWLNTAGHAYDTVKITMQSGEADIAAGDRLEVSSAKLKGKVGDQEILIVSSQKITGSFDCSLVKAEALNHSLRQELGIQGGDR